MKVPFPEKIWSAPDELPGGISDGFCFSLYLFSPDRSHVTQVGPLTTFLPLH